MISSDLVGLILDLANGFLQLANTDLGTFVTQILLLTSVGWGASELVKISKILPTIIGQFKTFGAAISLVSEGAGSLGEVLKVAGNGTSVLSGAMLTALPAILAVSTAIVGVIKLIDLAQEAQEKAFISEDKYIELNNQLEANAKRLEEIERLPWGDKTKDILEEKIALEEANKELQEYIDLYNKQQSLNFESGESDTYTFTAPEKFGLQISDPEVAEKSSKVTYDTAEAAQEAAKAYEELGLQVEFVSGEISYSSEDVFPFLTQRAKELTASFKDGTYAADEFSKIKFDETVAALKQYSQEQAALGENTEAIDSLINSLTRDFENYTQGVYFADASLNQLKNQYPQLSSYLSEFDGNVKLNIESLFDQENQTVETKVALFDLAAQMVAVNNTGLDLSAQISQLNQLAIAAGMSASSIALLSSDELENSIRLRIQSGMSPEEATNSAITSYYKALSSSLSTELSNVQTEAEDLGKSTSSSINKVTQKTDEALKRFEEYYEDLQHLRNMDEIDQEEYLNRLNKLVEDYTNDATANMEEYGTNSKEIARNMYQYEEELLDGWKELQEEKVQAAKEAQEKIIESLEEEQSIYEKFFSYMTDRIQDKIEELQEKYNETSDYWDEQIQAVKDQNAELEKQIQLEEKLDALARAKQTQVLVYKDGQFQYVQDVEAINEAEAELESFEREQALQQEVDNLEQLKENALQSIQDQIDGWEEYKEEWSSVVDHYQEEQDRLLIEQELGIELEGENWQLRLENLEMYVTQYEALMQRVTNAQLQLEKIENGDLSGLGGGFGGGGSNITFGPTYDSSTDYLNAAIQAASRGDIDAAQELWNRRGNKIQAEGDDRGTSQSEAWQMIMDAYNQSSSANTGGFDFSQDSSPNYGGYEDRDDLNDAIQDAFDKAQSSGDKIYIGDSGLYIDPDKIKGNAQGTLSSSGGLRLVGEKGPELRILNQGDGIIPSNATKNLIELSKYSVKDILGQKGQITYSYAFDKLVLPAVTDAKSFINELKRFKQFAYQQ